MSEQITPERVREMLGGFPKEVVVSGETSPMWQLLDAAPDLARAYLREHTQRAASGVREQNHFRARLESERRAEAAEREAARLKLALARVLHESEVALAPTEAQP